MMKWGMIGPYACVCSGGWQFGALMGRWAVVVGTGYTVVMDICFLCRLDDFGIYLHI